MSRHSDHRKINQRDAVRHSRSDWTSNKVVAPVKSLKKAPAPRKLESAEVMQRLLCRGGTS